MADERSDIETGIWRGRVEAFMETTPNRINTLFESLDSVKEKVQILSDKHTHLASRMAVVVAIASFIGTIVTSLFISILMKVFLK